MAEFQVAAGAGDADNRLEWYIGQIDNTLTGIRYDPRHLVKEGEQYDETLVAYFKILVDDAGDQVADGCYYVEAYSIRSDMQISSDADNRLEWYIGQVAAGAGDADNRA